MGGIPQLAAKAILKNLKALAAQVPGVRARRGAEPVHDLRVASRRVRTALKLLDETVPPGAPHARRDAKRRRRWGRELKRVTTALGVARDTDVQADFVREFLKKLPAKSRLRPGVERLLLRMGRRRDEEQRKVVKELDRLKRRDVLREIRREFQEARARASAPRASDSVGGKPPDGASARATASGQIARLLRRMLAHERSLARPERKKALHEMRIAAKRFRYTMEAVAPLFGARLDPRIRAARKIQTDLGDIHDCDVWISRTLPRFLAEERARALAELKPGIAALLLDRRNQRNAAYRAFLRFWKKLRRKQTWEQLRKLLREARQMGAVEQV